MKILRLLVLFPLLTSGLHAATINWTTASVSGPGDVSTAGTLVGAMNVGGPAAGAINGVTFAGDVGGTSAQPLGWATVGYSFEATYNQFWTAGDPGGSGNYHTALDWARYADGAPNTGTVTLSGLVPGAQYQVQLWIVDTRGGPLSARVRTVDGTNTTAAGPNLATGTFTADAGGTQVITIAGNAAAGHGPQLNMIQLRETARPPIVVTSGEDSGAGTLREALATAASAARPGPDTITFAPALSNWTITLAATLSLIDAGSVTVDASALPVGITLSRGSGTFVTLVVNYGSVLTLTSIALRASTATSGAALRNSGNVTFERCTVSNHNVAGGAGAIENTGTMTLTHCTLSGNSGLWGGAIYNAGASNSRTTLHHCTLSNNRSTSSGTLSGGGAIDHNSAGPLTMTACILAGNTSARTPARGPDLWMERGTVSARNCLIGDGTDSALTNGADGNWVGTAGAPLNAWLSPTLSNYGGPTDTLPPQAPSPAVDRVGFLNGMAASGLTDQRGTPRGAAAWSNDFSAGLNGAIARGTAEIDTGSLRLTEAVGEHAGTLVLPDLGDLSSFAASFDYIFSHNDYPADGMSFSFGPAPGGIVVEGGINPGHALKFDIYNGGGPVIGRISYLRNGVEVAADSVTLHRANDRNLWRSINIAHFSNGTLLVTYRGVLVINANTGYTYAPGDRFVFGSRTGGLVAEQRVDNVAILTHPSGVADIGAVERIRSLNVTHSGDSGTGSLRWAMLDAARVPGGTPLFDPSMNGATIHLASPLEISRAGRVILDASSLTRGLTLSGDTNRDGTGNVRILSVAAGGSGALHGLTLTKGYDSAINNAGSLMLTRCSLVGNSIFYSADGGGAIQNTGILSLQHCTLAGNVAESVIGDGAGGAISNGAAGTLSVSQCTIAGNRARGTPGGFGGGIANGGTMTLANSIVAQNAVENAGSGPGIGEGADIATYTTIRARGRNHVNGFWRAGGTTMDAFEEFIAGPTGLGGLAYYGGSTPVMPLLAGSFNIDRSDYFCGLAKDQSFTSRGTAAWTNDFNDGDIGLNGASVRTAHEASGVEYNTGTINSGSLLLTPALNAQIATLVLPDLGAFTGFTANFNYRWTATAANRPAQGLSFCFGPAPAWATNEQGPANCHVVSFNIYNNNNNAGSVTYHRPGAAVSASNNFGYSRVDDANKWNAISITLKPDGKLTVKFNSSVLLNEVATGYTAADGRIFTFGCRNGTGTAASEQRLDDIAIVTNPTGLSDIGAVDYVAGLQNPIVVNRDNSGPGSLRDTIAAVPAGSTIGFSPLLENQEIGLLSELDINKSLTLDAGAVRFTLGGSLSGIDNNTRHLRVRNGASVTVKNFSFERGTGNGFEQGNGGSIHNAGTLTLKRCTLSRNSGASGGAIYNFGLLTLDHCTVTNNTANGQGGAIHQGDGTLWLTHSTISGNTATGQPGSGGGMSLDSGTSLVPAWSIIAGNNANFATDMNFIGGNAVTVNAQGVKNLISNSSGNGVSGASWILGLPFLAPLGDYGGPTKTMPLRRNSPAWAAAAGSTAATDQRGFARPAGGKDLGAYQNGTWPSYHIWAAEVFPYDLPSGMDFEFADADGDGAINGQEYGAGTDPWNRGSVLRVSTITRSGANLVLTFTSVTGRNYTLWQSDALGAWTNTGLAAVAGNGIARTFTVPAPAAGVGKRFYRVQAAAP